MDRYQNRPFLRILECYVLDIIGELDEREYSVLDAMTPKLQKIFGFQGTWVEIVETKMGFPEELRGHIQELFKKNVARAEQVGATVKPDEFAKALVDEYFPAIEG